MIHTKEDFCKDLGISVERFDEITAKLDNILDVGETAWIDVIKSACKISNDSMECIVLGMCMGRMMQEEMCDCCHEEDEVNFTLN